MIRSVSAASSAAKPVAAGVSLAAAMRSRAAYGAGACPCTLASATARPRAIAASQAGPRSTGARSGVTRPVTMPAAQSSERSRKSAASYTRSTRPSRNASAGRSIVLSASGFSTMTVTAASAPTRLGSSQLPPQPGTSPRKHSGNAIAPAALDAVR